MDSCLFHYPLISIITVTKDDPLGLRKTLESISNQTYPNIELIVIDGGSDYEIQNIIKDFQSLISHWISEADQGIYFAMNKGLDLATGFGVMFMNSGDSFEGEVLNRNVSCPSVFGCKIEKKGKFKNHELRNIKFGMPTSHQCFLYENSSARFNTNYRISADYDYTLNNFDFINSKKELDSFVIYEADGLSSKRYWLRDWENFQIVRENFGIMQSMIFLMYMVAKNLPKIYLNN